MVLLGGCQCVGNYTTNSLITKSLFSMDQAVVYNTITNQWRNQSLGGIRIPDSRTYHSSVTSKFISTAVEKKIKLIYTTIIKIILITIP